MFADFRLTYATGWNSELTPPPRCEPLLELGADDSLPPLPKYVFAALKKMGHTSFRAAQEEVRGLLSQQDRNPLTLASISIYAADIKKVSK